MKQTVVTGYSFNAAAKTLDLSSISGFTVERLYAVINLTRSQVIYAAGIPAYGYASLTGGGTILNLVFNTTSYSNTDLLEIIYDTVNTDLANAWLTKLTDGTNVQGYTALGEAKVVTTNDSVIKAQLQDNVGTAITLGQKLMAASVPVAIASDQSPVPVSQSGSWSIDVGVPDETAFVYGTSIFQSVGGVFQDTSPTLSAGQSGATRLTAFRGMHVNLRDSSGNEKLGQQTMAASIPVAIASDQSPVSVAQSGTWTVQQGTPPWSVSQSGVWTTGRTWTLLNSTDSVNAVQSGTWNITNISGTISLPTNAAQETGGHLASIDSKLADDGSGNLKVNLQTSIPAGGNQIGSVQQGTAAALAGAWPVEVTDGTHTMPTMDVAARAGFMHVTDGTNSAAVKAASTAALATDPSLVVAFSPNSPLPTGANVIGAVTQSGTWTVQQGTPPWSVSQSGAWITGRTWTLSSGSDSVSAVQSGTWNITNISGTISLPTNAAQETGGHLASIDGKLNSLGQKTMANSMPVAIASDQTAIPVSQSGAWTTGRTWTLSSGTDSIGAVQSGTWTVQQGSAPWSFNLSQVGGVAFALGQAAAAGSLPVVAQADSAPATQNVTTQDLVSTTTAQLDGQNAITGIPTAGSSASFAVASFCSVEVQITGTWTGTLSSEFSVDGGTTWYTRGLKLAGTSYFSSTFTANAAGGANIVGATNYRIRATAAMTGTATIKVVFSVNQSAVTVSNPLTLRDSVTQSIANTIKAASTPAAVTDTALVVAISPNNTVAVTQSTSPWVDNITQFGGTNISTGTGASGAGIPRVTVANDSNILATQSGNWSVRLQDGSGNAIGSTSISSVNYLNVKSASSGATGSVVPTMTTQIGGSDGTDLRTLVTDTSGNLNVVGNVASGSADSGNPVKVGGKFNSTPIALTNGQRGDLQLDSEGNLLTRPGNISFSNITTATTTTVKSGAGRLWSVNVNTGVAGATITIYNNTTGTGTKIGTITLQGGGAGIQAFVQDYKGLTFSTGLTLVTSGATDITVLYQ